MKLKNALCFSFLIIFLTSCKKAGELQLTLLNDKIVCLEGINVDNVLQANIFSSKSFDSISRNVLHYKLVNNSDKKYFLVLNEDIVGSMETNDYAKKLGIEKKPENLFGLDLYKDNLILSGNVVSVTGGDLNCFSPLVKELYVDSLFLDNVKKKKLYKEQSVSIYYRDVLNKSFVIYPGETKYFTSVVNLPYRKGKPGWITNISTQKPNYASLSLANYSSFTKQKLSDDQKKMIEENGYELFDGVIYSNKVPVEIVNIGE